MEHAFEKLLQEIILLMPQTTKNQWAISKIHEQMHVTENMWYYGAHNNVHTGPQEHNHIKNTKCPSNQVQRNKDTFDFQLGNCLADKYCINAAYNKFNPPINIDRDEMMEDKCIFITQQAKKFEVTMAWVEGSIHAKYNWISQSLVHEHLPINILQAIQNEFPERSVAETILCFTEIMIDGDYIGLIETTEKVILGMIM